MPYTLYFKGEAIGRCFTTLQAEDGIYYIVSANTLVQLDFWP